MLRNIILTTTMSVCCLEAFASPRLDVLYHAFKDSDAIYESRVFLPIYHKNGSMLFSDIRAIGNMKDMTEVNLGLGLRQHMHSMNTVLGLYYFYDQRSEGGIYRQNTIGGEVLLHYLEARANYYMPFKGDDDTGVIGAATVSYEQNIPYINKVSKGALKGYDAEVGLMMPTKHFDMGVYAGLYKFYNDDESATISGYKVRGEATLANVLPFNMLVTIGGEYDYDDNPDNRVTHMNFKVGLPLHHNNNMPDSDRRMSKSVVRDLHIRVLGGGNAREKAQAKVKLDNGSEVVFDKIIHVKTEQEALQALSGAGESEKLGLVIDNDLMSLETIKLKPNSYLVGKKINVTFSAIGDSRLQVQDDVGKDVKLTYSGIKSADASGKMVDIDSSDQRLSLANISKITKYSYDGTDYTEGVKVSDETSLREALSSSGKKVLVLGEDIELTDSANIAITDETVVLGKGELKITDESGSVQDLVFNEQRKMPDKAAGTAWSYKQGISNNLTVDGVIWDLGDRFDVGNKEKDIGLVMKNTVVNVDKNLHGAVFSYHDAASHSKNLLENVTINKNGGGAKHGGVLFTLNNAVSLKNLTINQSEAAGQTGVTVFTRNNATVEGTLTLTHYDNLVWNDYNEAELLTFKNGTMIIVEDKKLGTSAKYNATADVGIVGHLENKSVNFDLSTLGNTNLKKAE